MGKNKLFCVLGKYVQYYNDVNIDGLCDYAFFTFYGKHDVAFKCVIGPVQATFIRKSKQSKTTIYGIHIPPKTSAAMSWR
ncbi:hypothetical protein MRX96_024543 [Rhipicephalus microplus]